MFCNWFLNQFVRSYFKTASIWWGCKQRERKLGTSEPILPNEQLAFDGFAARKNRPQPAIDACNTAICHHPHISFSGCFDATDRSIQYPVSTTFRQADHCRTLYRLWCEQDFSAADHHHPLCTLSAFALSNAWTPFLSPGFKSYPLLLPDKWFLFGHQKFLFTSN